MVHNKNTVPFGAQEPPAQWPSVQGPGVQAGLPAAIQTVSQAGERGYNHTANNTPLPGPRLNGDTNRQKYREALALIFCLSFKVH